MRERRPTSTRSSPQAQAAPCSQAACRRPDPARRPLHSCTGTAGDRRKGAREKKKKKNPGWQRHAVLALHTSFRERVLLPTLTPAARALLHSQSGPHAGMWLAAIPSDAASTLTPDLMHVALRRRLRLPLPLTGRRCGAQGRHGCGAEVDAYGDHSFACPRTGLLPRRGFVVERAWVQVAREAVGSEGRVVPQQWLAHTIRRRKSGPTTAAVSTSSSTGRRPLGRLCVAMRHSCPPSLAQAAQLTGPTRARAGVALDAARRRKVATCSGSFVMVRLSSPSSMTSTSSPCLKGLVPCTMPSAPLCGPSTNPSPRRQDSHLECCRGGAACCRRPRR